MCDSLHPFRVHADHLTTTKTDRYGLMVPYTFFSFPRQVPCLPGIFVSRPSLSRFRVGEFTAFPSLERPCRGQALSGCGLCNSSVVPEPFFPSERPNALPSESGSSGGHNNLKSIFKMERKIYDFRGVKVSLRKESYRTNGTLAVIMDEVESGDEYAVMTVNLCSPMQDGSRLAFVDTNNIEGIDKWLVGQGLATHAGVLASSGFCTYPLMSFNTENF